MGITNLAKTPAVTGGSVEFGAEDIRRMALDVYATEGVTTPTSFVPTQRAAGANMSIDVSAGAAIVRGDHVDGNQGKYYVRSLATTNVVITAADPSNPRIDRLVLEVLDSDYDGSGVRVARLRTIDGTATSGANAVMNENGIAAMPDSAIEIARITVGAGSTSIVTANIHNKRIPAIVNTGRADAPSVVAPPYFNRPYVSSGAAGSDGGGLNIDIATGAYVIGGMCFHKPTTERVTLNSSSTNRVWLQIVRDGSGSVIGTQWVVRTDDTVPSGEESVLTHLVVTGPSTITNIYDSYRGIIAPGKVISYQKRTSTFSQSIGASSYTPGLFDPVNLTGDGRTRISGLHKHPEMSVNASGNRITPVIRDDVAPGADVGAAAVTSPGTNYYMACHVETTLEAFASLKTLNGRIWNGFGTAQTVALSTNQAAAPGFLIFRWDY